MNISSQEQKFLLGSKLKEGKSFWEAEFEIERDKEFLKTTKDYKKQAEHLLSQLDKAYKEIETLRYKLKAASKEKFVAGIKNYEDNNEKATVVNLTRILMILEDGPIAFCDLARSSMTSNDKCKSALGFLSRFGIVEIAKNRNSSVISLIKREEQNKNNGIL